MPRRTVVRTELLLLALALACGRPEVRSVKRYMITIDESTVSPPDAHGDRQVIVVAHRDDCPADRVRMSVWAGNHATADCLSKLAVGSHVERVDVVFRHPLISCGGPGPVHNNLGGCPKDGISFEQLGTPCATP